VTGSGPLDWARRGGGLQRSTFLELFFDLVFVLALTQLSSSLAEHLNWSGAYRTLVLVMAVWWTWGITIWVTDLYEEREAGLQVLILTNMFGVLVMATSAQGAYGSQGEVFAGAYIGVHIVRGLVLVPAVRRHAEVRRRPLRVLVWFVASAPLWLAGGLAHGHVRVALWTLGLAVDYGAAALRWPLPVLGRSPDSEWDFGAEHISERYRQMFIIALGDTILTMGLTYVATPSTVARAAALVLCFVTTVLLWQIYFRFAAALLANLLAAGPPAARLARVTVYHHLLMVMGIVLTAVGNEVTIGHPLSSERPGWVLPIVGGPVLFLVGRILFGHLVLGHLSPSRVGGLILLLLLTPVALHIPPLAVTAATAAILTLTLLPNLHGGLARRFHEPLPQGAEGHVRG
jgi:low temperature requirement protein LtrA